MESFDSLYNKLLFRGRIYLSPDFLFEIHETTETK